VAGSKPEFPPLFSAGFHTRTFAELHDLLVLELPNSKTRPALWKSLEWLVVELKARAIKCELWINGSFTTEKIDPDNVDFVATFDVDYLNGLDRNQQTFVMRLVNQDFKAAPKKLHSFIRFTAPIGYRLWLDNGRLRRQTPGRYLSDKRRLPVLEKQRV